MSALGEFLLNSMEPPKQSGPVTEEHPSKRLSIPMLSRKRVFNCQVFLQFIEKTPLLELDGS